MRKIVGLLFFVLIAITVSAQFEKGKYLLLKPSLNAGNASFKTNGSTYDGTNRIGYGVGVELIQVLSKHFVIGAGAGLNSRGYKGVRALYLDVPLSVNYLTKPIDLLFHDQRILFGAGVYGGLALMGKYKNSSGSWTSMKFGESSTDNRSRFDGGFLFNLGATDEDLGALYISFMLGRKNVIPKDRVVNDNYIRLNTTTVSWGLPLKKLKKAKN